MLVHNAEIADKFDEVADLLDIEGNNPFRVRAYRNAARTIRGLSRPLSEMIASGEDLRRIAGVGEHIAAKIEEIVKTGKLAALIELERHAAPGLAELLKVSGLGPKRVKSLHGELGISSLRDLEKAAKQGRLRALPGFGAKTEEKVLASVLQRLSREERRVPWAEAEPVARQIADSLRELPGVDKVEIAGSFRRHKDTVGDVDILVAGDESAAVSQRFVEHEDVDEVLSHGPTRASIRLRSGLQVDLRSVPARSFGSALHYLTGSKAHNIAVRKRGVERGLKINEYGVFRQEKRIAGATEAEVYGAVGLCYIEPELREDRGEIQAAQAGRLPALVTLDSIRGDLHVHTDATDGSDTLADMVRAAAQRGYEYVAITDHTQNARVAGGLGARAMRRHLQRIERLRSRTQGIKVLASAEVDILKDGSLDASDDLLRELDIVVCAVHDHLGLSLEKQTARILRAMDHPSFHVLSHPTGRLLGERPPCAVDMERVIAHAAERGAILELDSQPQRLDLSDVHCRAAREAGVLVSISSDAHSAPQLDFMRYGVGQARRGWLEAKDVLNTRPWREIQKLLRRK